MMRLDSALSWWHEEVARREKAKRHERPLVVRFDRLDDSWSWFCRECRNFCSPYLYRDDAIHFGVYHLRAHQPSEEMA